MKTRKNKIISLLKNVLLSFLVTLLFLGCVKDTETELFSVEEPQKEKYALEMLSTSDIPNISATLKSKLVANGLSLFPEDRSAYQTTPQATFQSLDSKQSHVRYWIDESSVIKLTNEKGGVTYAFKIVSSEPSETTFYNLIVSNPIDGQKTEPFVIRYTHANGITRDEYNSQTNKRFKGRITVYSLKKFSSSLEIPKSIGMVALSQTDTSCADIIADDDSDTHNSSGGSGSSGNGGGSYNDGGSYYGDSSSGSSWSSQGLFGFGGSGKTKKPSVEVGIGCFCVYIESDKTDDKDKINFSLGYTSSTKDNGCPDNDTDVPINDGEDDIIINELTGKAKCLNGHLFEKGNRFVKDIFSKFEGNNSEFDIIIKSEDRVFSSNSNSYVNGTTAHKKGTKTIRINISTERISGMPALGAVRTLIHEYIHADMFRKLNTKNPTDEELDFKKTYENFEKGNFNATPQHEAMAELYVNSLKEALKKFHKEVLVGDYNYLTDNGKNPIPNSFYEALAWQGLKEHDVKAYLDLSDSKKQELQNSLQSYYHDITKNCPE
ncbi:MAG: hypothetical protein ACPF80_02575 [Flavobacteriaceae bacterium]